MSNTDFCLKALQKRYKTGKGRLNRFDHSVLEKIFLTDETGLKAALIPFLIRERALTLLCKMKTQWRTGNLKVVGATLVE